MFPGKRNNSKVRGRVGFINRICYLEFAAKYPESQITYQQYISILKESSNTIRDFIAAGELGFKLPYDLGYIAVHKYKPTGDRMIIDWQTSKRLGKKVPYTNLHSFGYIFKVNLYKNSKVNPLKGYKMEAHRLLKRMVAAKAKSGKSNYISIDANCFSKRFSIDNYLKSRQK